jgi:hypothetical protein
MFRSSLSLDRRNVISTVLVGALVGAILLLAWSRSDADASWRAVWAAVAALVVAWAMAPRALVVEGGELRIERRLWPALRVPLADVERASPIDSLGKGVLRLGGVGGFFGSYGFFRSERLGWFRLYGTRRGQAVLIARHDALPLVVTPDDVAGAIDAIDPRPRLGAYREEPTTKA